MPVLMCLVNVNPSNSHVKKIYAQEETISPHEREENGKFLAAVARGDLDSVKRFLEDGEVSVDAEGEDKETALTSAVFNGNMALCQLLIDYGCDVNKSGTVPPFHFRLTPLCQAVSTGHSDIVQLLLKSGCKQDLWDDLGRPAVFYSVSCADSDMLKLLLESGCDVNVGTRESNHTLLHEAVAKGKVDMVKVLLEAGANPNIYEVHQRLTPAFFTTRTEVHELLIKYGANINHTSRSGDTVLHHAITHGDLPLMEFFLEKGAILDAVKTNCVYSSRNILQKLSLQDPVQQAAHEHYFHLCIGLLQHGCSTEFTSSRDDDLATRLLNSENTELILVLLFASGTTNWLKEILLEDQMKNLLTVSKDTRDWLCELAGQVLPLKMLACHTIRKQLKTRSSSTSIFESAKKLEIPELLLDCILLKGFS